MPITTKVVSLNSAPGEVYLMQHSVIKFVSDLPKVGGSLRVTPTSSTTKTGCQDIAEILLKVALTTKYQNQIKSNQAHLSSDTINPCIRLNCLGLCR